MTKKIISILLLILFLFNVSGYFVVFKLRQYNAREEMKTRIKQNLRDEEMEVIIIQNSEINSPLSDFCFIEEDEFRYKGNLYDIVRKKTEGSNTVFYCINDKQEEKLFDGLNEHIKRNTDQNTPTKDKSNTLTKSIVKEALPEKPDFIAYSVNQHILYFKYNSLTNKQFIPVPSPPPKS